MRRPSAVVCPLTFVSKAALHQLSRVLASQLAPRGVTVNTLACGPFESKMMAATLDAFRETIEAGLPVGRIGTVWR